MTGRNGYASTRYFPDGYPLYNAPMQIPCPQCKILVTPPAGAKDNAIVVCANCGHRFNPRKVSEPDPTTIDRLYRDAHAAPAGIRPAPEDIARHARAAPPRVRTRNPVSTLFWALTSLLLILTLIAQYAYVERDELARHAQMRPWLEWLCMHAGCELPMQRAPDMIRIAGRDIRRHPDIGDALIVNITITNHAPWAQTWPVIELGFFDLRNRPLALRRFTAEEYLPHSLSVADGMPVQTPIRVRLDILDPGPDAVNFSFTLM